MAKATLEFDLSDYDDRKKHMRAVRAEDMASALWHITHNTKKGLGFVLEGKDINGEEFNKYDVLELVFDKIYEILNDHDINTDTLLD